MSDYIKREDAEKILLQRREFADNQGWTQEVDLMELLCERIDELPAADVVERKRGKWREDMWLTTKGYSCSECNCFAINPTIFCPDCGADMRVKDDN